MTAIRGAGEDGLNTFTGEVTELLQQLIRFNTVNPPGAEQAAQEHLAGVLTAAHGAFAPAIATISCIYFFGLIVLLFARETKGQALPD